MSESNKSTEVSRLLHEIMKLIRSNMSRQFEDFGITGPQGMVIRTMSQYGEMKVSDLSNKLCLSNSTVSGILDRLEKLGFVERTRSTEDRRIVYVSLTPKFQGIHQRFHEKTEENIKSILSKGSPGEIDKVIEGLTILKKLLSE